jgi:hypothetical protein
VGFRIAQNNDYSYPLLAWHPNNRILAIITEEKGFIWLYFYDIQKKKLTRNELFGFQKILSFSYSQDGKELLFSAVKQGQPDVFVYTILSRSVDQITNDDYTDLYPTFFNGDKQIVFSSNRVDDTLRANEEVWRFSPNNDLFIYNRSRKDDDILWRLTNTPGENEVMATTYQPGYIGFLSNPNGSQERFLIGVDSTIAYVDTIAHYDYNFSRYKASSLSRNISEEDFSPNGERTVTLYFKDRRYRIYDSDYIPAEELNLRTDEANSNRERQKNTDRKRIYAEFEITEETRVEDVTRQEIDINDYQFDPSLTGKYGPKKNMPPAKTKPKTTIAQAEESEDEDYDFPPARNYFVTFLRDNFTTKVDFVFDNPQYQTFTGVPDNQLLNAGFNVQFKLGAVDLFNNYRLVGGFRTDFMPVAGLSLSPNSEFIIGLVNHKKRLNKELSIYRRSQLTTLQGFFNQRLITYEAHMKFIWPFNEVQSIQGSVGGRHQRSIVLSDSPISLPIPSENTDYGILKAAFIHDNTRKLGINLYKGTRYKVFTEYYRNFSISNSGMHTLGIDFRNYVQLHRTLIFATRFAAGTSFGQEKLIHYMGGVDNTINPRLNTETPISTTENYRFQTVVTNMRGFRQNVRNGNSFAVINGELRWPIFRYLVNRPIRSDFINSFQIVGFGDVGTAWNGPHLGAMKTHSTTGQLKVETLRLSSIAKPTRLLAAMVLVYEHAYWGYFVRADWAWGVENGVILDSIFYFSLSTDF